MIKLGRSEAPPADQITASDQSSCTSHNPLAFQLDRPRASHLEFVLKIQSKFLLSVYLLDLKLKSQEFSRGKTHLSKFQSRRTRLVTYAYSGS